MALKGTINGSTANKYIDSKIEWSAVQDISGNYSNVTATLYYSRNNTGYTTSGTWSGSITINGTKFAGGPKWLILTEQSNTVAMTCTVKVPHNSDGTKTITISATGSIPGTTLSSTSISSSVTLNTIPRASSLTLSASSVDVGSIITANISRHSSSFKHNVEFYTSSMRKHSQFSLDKNKTSKEFPIPKDWIDELASSSSCTAYCRLTTLDSSDNQIGDYAIKSFTITVPSNIKPSIGSITLTPTPITLKDGSSVNLLVKGKNTLRVSAVDCSAGEGSYIESYAFSGPSLNKTVSVNNATSCSATSGTITSATTLTYKVTVTDARGSSRAVTQSKTIVCHDYFTPSISDFKATRISNADGTSAIKCTYTTKYAPVDGTNTYSVIATYTTGTTVKTKTLKASGDTIDLGTDTDSVYQVRLTISDAYSGSSKSDTVSVYGVLRTLNITSDGTGIAFGKCADKSEFFECRWPAQFDDDVTISGDVEAGFVTATGILNSSMLLNQGDIMALGKVGFGTPTQTASQASLYTDKNSEHENIVYIRTGANTSGGEQAGIAIHETSVYVPDQENSGIVNLGSSGRQWNQLYAKQGTIATSDRNKKKDILDMSDAQAGLFSTLRPVTYKMISGTSDRTHYGFVAQDIEDSLSGLGLTGQDFAGFCKDIKIDDNGNPILDNDGNVVYDYALRYSEFIALNTYMIQQLQKTIRDQQEEINSMKAEIDKLNNKIS